MKIFVIDKYRFAIIVSALFSAAVFLITCLTGTAEDSRLLPIYSVDTEEKVVAITFDSAWTADDLPSINNTLNEYNCKATFFVVGSFAEKYPDSIKMLSDAGHEIAGHSYNHAHYNSLSESELVSDMTKCDNVINEIIGKNSPLFRAPYGEYNNTVVDAATKSGRTLIQWDVDSLDWKSLSESEMLKRIMPKVKNGSIILLHNGTENTASALPAILSALKDEGFGFKTVNELIYKDNYYIDADGCQKKN